MTLAVDDDFAGFVAARWPDLEAVAIAAVLEPDLARELTTSTLASLGEHWEGTVDEGAPTRAARVELIRRVARVDRDAPPRPDAGSPGPPTGSSSLPADDPDVPTSAVPGALLSALQAEHPLIRAALAAQAVWGTPEDEFCALGEAAGVPAARLTGGLTSARARLLAAHRAALAADGLSPADWRLEHDLADVVDALAAAQPDPPDPAGLVADRTRRVRRRTLLVGGTAVLLAGGTASWLIRGAVAGETDAAAVAGGAQPAGPTARGVGVADPVWDATSQWPPRGRLADDNGIQALVIRDVGAGGRLVFADDVEGVRVVVATVVEGVGGSGPVGSGPRGAGAAALGTVVRAWYGPPGTAAEGLVPVELGLDRLDGAPDVLAVAVPGSLVVLTRPTVAAAAWSPIVHPTVNGSVERTWTLIRMTGGVGTRRLDAPLGAAARIQCSQYDGPIPGTRGWSASSPPRSSAAEVAADLVASATGVPADRLVSRIVVDSPVAGSVFDAEALSATGGDGRVQVVHTTTPDGGLVRTLAVADDGRSGRSTAYGPSAVIPAAEAGQPVVRRLDLVPPRTMRYLVVAPGAARCQLLAVAPAGYPVSKVVPLKGDTAIVPIVNGQDSNTYRLVLWDAAGRRTYSAVPPRGRALLDLEPTY